MIPWSVTGDGLVLTVRLTPKGGRDAIDGVVQLADGQAALKARVAAAPSEAALVKLVARTLGVAAKDVTLVSGTTSRLKRLKISGDSQALAEALHQLVGVTA